MTQMSYTAVPQLGQLLAQSAAALLPGQPRCMRICPTRGSSPLRRAEQATLPRAGGGTVNVGPGEVREAVRVLRDLGSGDQWPRRRAGFAEPLSGDRGANGPARLTAVDEASVEPSLEDADPASWAVCRIRCPIRSRSTGAESSPTATRSWACRGSCSPRATGQLLYYREVSTAGLAEHQRPGPLRQGGARPRPQAGRRRHGESATRRLTATARLAPPAGRPAARKPVRARRPHPRAARLSDRDQRLGVLVRAVPLGVRPVRLRLGPLRTAGRVPRRRHRRFRRGRSHVPRATPRQLPELRDDHPGLSSLAAIQGLPTTIFISPDGQGRVCAHRPIRLAGHVGSDISTYALSG